MVSLLECVFVSELTKVCSWVLLVLKGQRLMDVTSPKEQILARGHLVFVIQTTFRRRHRHLIVVSQFHVDKLIRFLLLMVLFQDIEVLNLAHQLVFSTSHILRYIIPNSFL